MRTSLLPKINRRSSPFQEYRYKFAVPTSMGILFLPLDHGQADQGPPPKPLIPTGTLHFLVCA